MPMEKTQRLLSDRELAALFGVSRQSVWRWVRTGALPPPLTVGERTRRWRQTDVEELLEQSAHAARELARGRDADGVRALH